MNSTEFPATSNILVWIEDLLSLLGNDHAGKEFSALSLSAAPTHPEKRKRKNKDLSSANNSIIKS